MRWPGSPPRAWGQLFSSIQVLRQERFTPTGVGTIVVLPAVFAYFTVHPHGRGDNLPRARSCAAARGSPPRAWGQCGIALSRPPKARFTPTGVGTMAGRFVSGVSTAVHPHGRGDNAGSSGARRVTAGSPPRAWGQSRVVYIHDCIPRFTPTGVGTIPDRRRAAPPSSVHPHGRGDNVGYVSDRTDRRGSPPRAWGQWFPVLLPVVRPRFTPTGVGTIVNLNERKD